MTKDHAYGSGKSSGAEGVSARRLNVLAAVNIETFRAAPNSLSEQNTAAESFEFEVGSFVNQGNEYFLTTINLRRRPRMAVKLVIWFQNLECAE